MLCMNAEIILCFLIVKINLTFKVAEVALSLGRSLADLFHLMFLVSFLKSTALNSTYHPMISLVKSLFHYSFMFFELIFALFALFLMTTTFSKGHKLMQLLFFTTVYLFEAIFTLLIMSLLIVFPHIHMIFLTPGVITVITVSLAFHYWFKFFQLLILEFMILNLLSIITIIALFATFPIHIIFNNNMLLWLHSLFQIVQTLLQIQSSNS